MSLCKPVRIAGPRYHIRMRRAVRRLARGLAGGITSPSRTWHNLFEAMPDAHRSLAKECMQLHEARMVQRSLNFDANSFFGFKELGCLPLPLREQDVSLEAPGVTDQRLAEWLGDTKSILVKVYNLCLEDAKNA